MKKIIIINFFIILFIILFLEFFVSFFKFSNLMGIQEGLIKSENNTHFLIPNSTGKVFGKKVFIDINGFRVPKEKFKYIGNKGVYIIGDSTTFGNGVLEENTFIGLLRNKFTEVNFFNSSVPGYQIKNHINNLNKIKNFNVDKIYYFFTLNDVLDSTNVITKSKINKNTSEGSFKLKEIRMLAYVNSYLRNKSYLYMFIKGIFTDPSKRWFLNINNFYKNNDISYLKNYFTQLTNFSNFIDAKLVVIILPYEYQTRECKSTDMVPQVKVKKILSNLNMDFRDYAKKFCAAKNPKNYFYKFDPMHLSQKGHKLVYDLIINESKF